jgi:dihydrolipoamide dehydrogenase
MTEMDIQVTVVGGGPGGYAAAFMAADLGMRVTLVDPGDHPGGVCLYRGCIPSKALLHAARVITEAKEAEAFGLSFDGLTIDPDRLRAWKADVVKQVTSGLGQLAQRKKISYVQGTAQFQDSRTLKVSGIDGVLRIVRFEYAVIATGAHPTQLSGSGIDSENVWDSTKALELPCIPKRLLVIGGGYIGLELGTAYAALGSQVHLAEMTAELLPGVDQDLVRFLRQRLNGRFAAIHLQTTVTALKSQKNGFRVTLVGPEGPHAPAVFDRVLAAVGRRPNSHGLGLEHTRVQVDERGFIRVDRQRRTTEHHIFAIGDVAGEPMLAHKASHEGRMVAEVLAQRKVAFDPVAVPCVVFTDPEIAWAGLTESEAKREGRAYRAVRFPWAASGRAATLGRSDGLTKLLVDSESERILGIGIVGPGAGELIAEGVLALEMGANATDMALTIHPHPTLSETLMEAADVFRGTSTHYHAPRRKERDA